MTDSSLSYQQFIETGRLALGRGDRESAEEALSNALRASDGLADVPAQHATALIELGVLREEIGCHQEAEALLRRALDVGERALGPDDPGLVRALTSLGAVLVARGAPEEAEPLLTRALAISESHFGPDHPDLVVLLNELTRLYLRQSAHAFAEPLLVRLHAIKRRKGEEHPEVATVLASLAEVQRALGRHDAAEQLCRRVLEIRERTLAPNHFAIAVAHEQLAETCAARGKFREALPLLQRAQTIRELTLGAGHPSLRIARERIADLQLQASEGSLDPPDAGTDEPVRDPPASLDAARAARAARLLAGSCPAPPAAEPFAPPVTETTVRTEPTRGHALVLPYMDGLLHVQNELQVMSEDPSPTGRARLMVSSAAAELRKRRASATITGASALALLMAGLGASTRARGGGDQMVLADIRPHPESTTVVSAPPATPVPPLAAVVTAASTQDSSMNAPEARAGVAVKVDTLASALATPAALPSRPRALHAAKASLLPQPVVDDSANAPPLPAPVTLGLDSIVHVIDAKVSAVIDPIAAQLTSSLANSQFTPYKLVESLRRTTEARLIGPLPQPVYPPALRERHVQGEVFVQFIVDTAGRPDMATLQVVRSPHYLLTAAVREVVPHIRFEPARAAGVESKPLPVMAGVAFRFTANQR
jgi:TonB family protein